MQINNTPIVLKECKTKECQNELQQLRWKEWGREKVEGDKIHKPFGQNAWRMSPETFHAINQKVAEVRTNHGQDKWRHSLYFSDWVDAPSCLLFLKQLTAYIWPFSLPKLTSFTLVYCHAICSNIEPVKQNLFGIGPCVPLHYVRHCPLSALCLMSTDFLY